MSERSSESGADQDPENHARRTHPGPHRKLPAYSSNDSTASSSSTENNDPSRQGPRAQVGNTTMSESPSKHGMYPAPQRQETHLQSGPYTRAHKENTEPSYPPLVNSHRPAAIQTVQTAQTGRRSEAATPSQKGWPAQQKRRRERHSDGFPVEENDVATANCQSQVASQALTQPHNRGSSQNNARYSNNARYLNNAHYPNNAQGFQQNRLVTNHWQQNYPQHGYHNPWSKPDVPLPPAQPWDEVAFLVKKIPHGCCYPRKIHAIFLEYGHVSMINCTPGNLSAKVVFAIRRSKFKLDLDSVPYNGRKLFIKRVGHQPDMTDSPIDPRKKVLKKIIIPVEMLHFGALTGEKRMMTMRTVTATHDCPLVFMLDLASEKRPRFSIRFFLTNEPSAPWYRFDIPLNSPTSIQQIARKDGGTDLVISSRYPPQWLQSVHLENQLDKTHENSRDEGRYMDWPYGWRRVTDISSKPQNQNLDPISFVREDPVIDTGRWLTWRISFPAGQDVSKFNEFMCILQHHNMNFEFLNASQFEMVKKEDPVIWQFLDPHRALYESDLHEIHDGMTRIRQDVRYQLEVCISNNKISEYNMDKEFFRKLGSMDEQRALVMLENVAESKRTIFDPMTIFTSANLHHSRKRRVPKGCVLMRMAIITPTTVYVKTPSVEISNRVVRDNETAKGNFLRVKFEDEESLGDLMQVDYFDNQHEVWERVKHCLSHGIDIAGRSYDWLACGNSQFRESGAYFFAPYDDKRNAESIRQSLGDFAQIRVVAKCMARIGQCFSTTKAFTNVGQVDVQYIEDIERNGFCFTDGVGKCSPFVAQMIASQFRIPGEYPSVFQFRMGGCKGILAVDTALKRRTIQVRPSQMKFETASGGLEIIRYSTFSSPTLNQQLILVLTSLGITKEIFVDKMTTELRNIDLAMTDEQLASSILVKNVDFNQVTLSMAKMIHDGFLESQEPFLQSLMELWRAWNLKYLKEKARIPIENGAFVFGCVDESDTLKMDDDDLPEIFLQIQGAKKGKWQVVEGICLLARNPSLHPGDVRVVRAVKCPALEHLKNVAVLPQKGKRPLANMCAGGDLDGDDYLVVWDHDLLPPRAEWNHSAMDYTPPPPVTCEKPVSTEELFNFFVDYIKHDNLGVIAVNHRAFADIYAKAGGIKHETCLKLAELHSMAVDFNKTGVPAKMERGLWPKRFPHWMPNKPESKKIKSQEVLGVLYDMVDRVQYRPLLANPFDERVLDACDLDESMLQEARDLKLEYDREIRRIMVQNAIKTEFEVWTAFVMEHNRPQRWYKLAEELGQLVANLKSEFETRICSAAGLLPSDSLYSDESFGKLGPFVTAMYKVTSQEVDVWRESQAAPNTDKIEGMPLISFPWLFPVILGKIANKNVKSHRRTALAEGPSDLVRRAPRVRTQREAESDRHPLEPLIEWTSDSVENIADSATLVEKSVPPSSAMMDLIGMIDVPNIWKEDRSGSDSSLSAEAVEQSDPSDDLRRAADESISLPTMLRESESTRTDSSSGMIERSRVIEGLRSMDLEDSSNFTDCSMTKSSDVDQMDDDSCATGCEEEVDEHTVTKSAESAGEQTEKWGQTEGMDDVESEDCEELHEKVEEAGSGELALDHFNTLF